MNDFFTYDEDELSKIDEDIRGLRIYRVSNLTNGAIGGREWHRIKKELVFVTKGRVHWKISDRSGNEKEFILTPNNHAILIPPYIMHTYTSLENNSEVVVITNTLYNVDNPSTFDTHQDDTF